MLLGTSVMMVRDAGGNVQPVRALLDSGSQISIISKDCIDGSVLDR